MGINRSLLFLCDHKKFLSVSLVIGCALIVHETVARYRRTITFGNEVSKLLPAEELVVRFRQAYGPYLLKFYEEPANYVFSCSEYAGISDIIQLRSNCGIDALYIVCNLYGKCSIREILENLPLTEKGVSLFSLKQFLIKRGIECIGRKLDGKKLVKVLECHQTALLFVDGNHFIFCTRYDNSKVTFVDGHAERSLTLEDLATHWDGTALVIVERLPS